MISALVDLSGFFNRTLALSRKKGIRADGNLRIIGAIASQGSSRLD